jgi:tRNA (Thr-GGU) A37 N-methylase
VVRTSHQELETTPIQAGLNRAEHGTQLLEVTGQAVTFAGVDLLDGTPVIDIKPYVTRFDRPARPTLNQAA